MGLIGKSESLLGLHSPTHRARCADAGGDQLVLGKGHAIADQPGRSLAVAPLMSAAHAQPVRSRRCT